MSELLAILVMTRTSMNGMMEETRSLQVFKVNIACSRVSYRGPNGAYCSPCTAPWPMRDWVKPVRMTPTIRWVTSCTFSCLHRCQTRS